MDFGTTSASSCERRFVAFFYIRVETVHSLLPEAVRILQSQSCPVWALASPWCLVHTQRQVGSGIGVYRVRGAVEGSSVDGRRCRISLPFSASPPRPCILWGIERDLGDPGIKHASPRESRHWCPVCYPVAIADEHAALAPAFMRTSPGVPEIYKIIRNMYRTRLNKYKKTLYRFFFCWARPWLSYPTPGFALPIAIVAICAEK